MDCYLGSESQTNLVKKNGWFLTGDLAYKNSDNEITLQGRIKNEINVKKVIKNFGDIILNLFLGETISQNKKGKIK